MCSRSLLNLQDIVSGGVEAEAEQSLSNVRAIICFWTALISLQLKAVIEASGSSFDKVIKTTVFLKNVCFLLIIVLRALIWACR